MVYIMAYTNRRKPIPIKFLVFSFSQSLENLSWQFLISTHTKKTDPFGPAMSCCDCASKHCNAEAPKPKILAVIFDLDGTLIDTGLKYLLLIQNPICFGLLGYSFFCLIIELLCLLFVPVVQSGLQRGFSRNSWPGMGKFWIRKGKRRRVWGWHWKTQQLLLLRTMVSHWHLISLSKKSSPCIRKSKALLYATDNHNYIYNHTSLSCSQFSNLSHIISVHVMWAFI